MPASLSTTRSGVTPTIFFFFNDTATTEIYTLSLHDALPICPAPSAAAGLHIAPAVTDHETGGQRSEEHTSELQSRPHLVCRLLLEKKKTHQCKDHLFNLPTERTALLLKNDLPPVAGQHEGMC